MKSQYDVYMCRSLRHKINMQEWSDYVISLGNSIDSRDDEERQEKVWNYWMEKVKREGGIKSPIADYLNKKGA